MIAEAIALIVGQSRRIWDFEDLADWHTRVEVAGMAPVVVPPTTSGAGRFALGRRSGHRPTEPITGPDIALGRVAGFDLGAPFRASGNFAAFTYNSLKIH